ncbi:NACHT domain-containing protein [Chloroflexi bacterium TSY]|nr:NACHT domain-containing protein [Chloroflexi bacterium TSY]
MDLQTWKEAVKNRLQQSKQLLTETTPNLLYGALSATTILPVVTAAHQGDFGAIAALTSVVGGVGGNLIASQLQAWKDRTDEELATELAQKAKSDAEWRQALDTLLEKLDTLRVVQAILSETDKDWFEHTLQTELEKLGSSLTVGGDVVIGGDQTKIDSIRKSMVAIGDNSSITYIVNHYRGDSKIDEEKVRQQIAEYLIWVVKRFGVIEMRGISHQGEPVVRLDLETVYVPLTAERTGRVQEAIEMNEVLKQGSCLIITGAPGGGKTTVLQHIAWVLAKAIVLDRPQLAQEKLGLEAENGLPLPLFVPLSAYAQRRRNVQNSDDPHQNTLATFISRYLITRQSGLDLPNDFFARLLDEGRSVILLLDGLDEVPDEHERVALRQVIEDLVVGRDAIHVVVTCRIAAYRGRTALGQGFQNLHVQALDDEHVAALVQHAYRAVYREDKALS